MELADAELIAEFVIESQEGLANIEQQMLAIESGGTNVDLDLVNAVFRTMHSPIRACSHSRNRSSANCFCSA